GNQRIEMESPPVAPTAGEPSLTVDELVEPSALLPIQLSARMDAVEGLSKDVPRLGVPCGHRGQRLRLRLRSELVGCHLR
ncbi:MAG TPA: hypothetical protein PK071_01820, partial [Atopobiaceae bacterium]|nr:hypothetical protein [Atopobiaceae bacterium]